VKYIAATLLTGTILLASCAALSGDPFGAPPKGSSPNCGPENRYQFNNPVSSTRGFVEFIRDHAADIADEHGNKLVQLDNFRPAKPGTASLIPPTTPIDWVKVENAVTTETVNGRKLYKLDFTPAGCFGQFFTLKMTTDGQVSVYGCCGV
jgi:hypothetical protein